MEKQFNEQDGMVVIRQMIEQAKWKLEKGDGKYFVLWGYLVALTCIAHYVSYTFISPGNYVYSGYIWAVPMLIGAIISFYFGWKDSKKETVKTYIGTMVGRIWIGFACMSALISFMFAGHFMIYTGISLVYAYAVYLSASAYRMKWMYISAAICAVCTILYRFIPHTEYPLLMAAMLICGNLIPGHVINYKARKNV